MALNSAQNCALKGLGPPGVWQRVENDPARDLLHATVYEYNLQGRKTYEGGGTYPVRFTYDDEGRMTGMTTYHDESEPGDTTTWLYDPATGLLVQKLYEDGKGTSYTYTPDGKLATRTWARGVVTEYGYDALGSLLSVNYSDATPDVTYTYDRIGRQLSAIAAGVSTNLFTYSTNTLELIAEVQNGVVINRSRDAFGRASGIALESDYDVGYGYDTFGRFAQVSNFQFQEALAKVLRKVDRDDSRAAKRA